MVIVPILTAPRELEPEKSYQIDLPPLLEKAPPIVESFTILISAAESEEVCLNWNLVKDSAPPALGKAYKSIVTWGNAVCGRGCVIVS